MGAVVKTFWDTDSETGKKMPKMGQIGSESANLVWF